MKIALLAAPEDRQTARLASRLEALAPGACARLDLTLGGASGFAMDDRAVVWSGHDLTAFDTVFVRGFSYMDPVVPCPQVDVDWSVWQSSYIIDQQRFSAQYSLLAELERRGVRVVNPVRALLLGYMKGVLLERLRRAGLHVPLLLCSNEEARVGEFMAQPGRTLWRPVTGRAAWQLFLDKQRRHLVAPERPPVLLAKAVDGPLLRCWMFAGDPLLCLAHDAPSCRVPERLEAFRPIDPATAGAAALAPVCAVTGATWIQVTYVLEGTVPRVYDVDPDPLLGWLPACYEAHLIEGLSSALGGLSGDATQRELPGEPAQRPTLFPRRMLQDLFVYEASKYPTPAHDPE